MGKLVYGASVTEIEIDDRTLAHLEIVIVAKLRRDEKFVLSWQHGQSGGGGRSIVWVHSAIPLHFQFNGSKEPSINPAWLKELMPSRTVQVGCTSSRNRNWSRPSTDGPSTTQRRRLSADAVPLHQAPARSGPRRVRLRARG